MVQPSPLGINYTSSPSSASSISGAGAATGAMVALQLSSNYFAGQAAAIGYKTQAAQQRQSARQARTDAKASSLKLSQRFNDVAANNAVMMAASGRSFSSGSVQNLMRVDQENLQWDLDYNKAAGEIGAMTIEANASNTESAARQAEYGGIQKGLLGAAQSYAQYKMIK